MSDEKTPDNVINDFLTEELLNQRRIFLFGDINETLAERTVKQLIYLSQSQLPITIFVCSDGGELEPACAIFDTINLIKTTVTVKTVCYKACSAAADIFAMGSKDHRYIFPTAIMMLHKTLLELPIDDEDKQQMYIEFMKEQGKTINELVAKACGKKIDKFIKDISQDLWLTAKQAVKYKIADRIVKDLSEI